MVCSRVAGVFDFGWGVGRGVLAGSLHSIWGVRFFDQVPRPHKTKEKRLQALEGLAWAHLAGAGADR